MKIATWNVNSLKVRLPHLLDWLAASSPDVVCLQELKLEDGNFPAAAIEAAGYHCAFSGQKTYNGVAILARSPLASIAAGNPRLRGRPEARTDRDRRRRARGLRVRPERPGGRHREVRVQAQVAARVRGLAARGARRAPEPRRARRLQRRAGGPRRARPASSGQARCSAASRSARRSAPCSTWGCKDSFRLFEQPEQSYTWWDYRLNAFKRNLGLRIDHILVGPALAAKCASCSDRRRAAPARAAVGSRAGR